MDLTQFGLRQRPFRSTPDTELYYPATAHEFALAELRRALDDEEGMALLTGEPGVGKTLLVYRLLEALGESTRAVFLTNTHWSGRSDLLQAILFDLALPYQGLTEQELRLAVTESCLEHFQGGGKTVVVADEAQHLTPDHLEELRLLVNLEGRHGKAVQVILVGLPELAAKLDQPGLAAVRQRLAVRARLEPLTPDESADYLMHHLRLAGGRPERLMSEEALDLIVRACHGLPRVLNQVASTAMSLTASAGSRQVDAEAALEALTRFGLHAEDTDAAEPHPAVLEAGPPASAARGGERPPSIIFEGADPEPGGRVEGGTIVYESHAAKPRRKVRNKAG
jgi:type II secretory pathway predicted ATPase ExeA